MLTIAMVQSRLHRGENWETVATVLSGDKINGKNLRPFFKQKHFFKLEIREPGNRRDGSLNK